MVSCIALKTIGKGFYRMRVRAVSTSSLHEWVAQMDE